MGMRTEIVGRDAIERLPEFDALFIRDTTHVNHYTYQFARRAVAEGLVVIDDPDSIVRATNKVFLYELLSRHQIPMPRSLIVHRDNVDQIAATLHFPCIVKLPDSAFSLGVAKVGSQERLDEVLKTVFDQSEIVVKTAVHAASVVGDGLYGVDLKQVGDRCYVIEVNDNPNIDAGNEDGVLKEALYREVLGVFLRRIREHGKPVEV